MTRHTVSIVCEDEKLRESVRRSVESAGLLAATFPTLQGFLDSQEAKSRGCFVFCPGSNTLKDQVQQARLAEACALEPGILISEGGDVGMAVQALKAGIWDVVENPNRDKQLLERITSALEAGAHS